MDNENSWTHTASFNDRLAHIVGGDFGDSPEKRLNEIITFKKSVFELIAKPLELKPNHVGLEIGCGIGLMTNLLAHESNKVYATDINKQNLEYAKNFCTNSNIHFELTRPPLEFQFINEKLDYIFSHAVFIHLNLFMIDSYFKHFEGLIKTGGRLYFDIANTDTIDFRNNSLFQDYSTRMTSKMKHHDIDISFNSQVIIEKIAREYGFSLIHSHNYPQGISDLYFEKQ